jgi:hypothetical protein
MNTDERFEKFDAMVDRAFAKAFEVRTPSEPKRKVTESYASIEEYTNKTGKRFRMLKEQKDRGLNRQEAFEELYGGSN